MKKTAIIHWVSTGIFAALMLFSAIPNIMGSRESIQMIHGQLGYPEYFVRYLGWAKLLGVVGVLIPTNARIKEWAYAGLAFDLISAVYSFVAIGLPVTDWSLMIVFFLPGIISYYYYRKRTNAVQVCAARSMINDRGF